MGRVLGEGQRILVNKMAYLFDNPERGGDIIVFRSPVEDKILTKRIIGKPSGIMEVVNNKAVLNGVILEEPCLRSQPLYEMAPFHLPEGYYFVLGDNRNNSENSHTGWTVPGAPIVGKALIFMWPPDKWGVVENFPLETNMLAQKGK